MNDHLTGGSRPGPLAGVLVLDFGQAAVGPVSASYLSMLGATVIKIEQPAGDTVRMATPKLNGTSSTYVGNNIGKFGLVLDLKSSRDRQYAIELVSMADIMLDNFRSPSVMSRLGLDYFDVLKPLNPGLIYLQSSAFGMTGPWNGMISFEWMAQASSGMSGATGAVGGPPELSRGTAHMDWNGAMMNLIAMLSGLQYRHKTGQGLMLETSQFGSSVYSGLSRLIQANDVPHRNGSAGTGFAPDQTFAASDGFISVSAPTDAIWRRLCAAVGRPDLAADAMLGSGPGRFRNRQRIEKELGRTFAGQPREEWVSRLREARVPVASVEWDTTISRRLEADAQVQAGEMMTRQESSYGPVLTQTPHWRIDRRPTSLRRPSPQLGEHSELILSLMQHPAEAGAPSSSGSAPTWGAASMTSLSMDRVLEGVRIVELGSGPCVAVAGMVLTTLGATVDKIEVPSGDYLRSWGGAAEDSTVWRVLNGGKRIGQCDLKGVAGQSRLRALLADADAVLVALTPEARVRLGCDHESLGTAFPGLIYCGITGWGTDGPLAGQPATELDVQIASGMYLQVGRHGEDPVRVGVDLVTMNTGYAAVQGILAMLYAKQADGEFDGDHIEVSMMHTAAALSQWVTTAESDPAQMRGRQLEAYTWEPDSGYQCKDRRALIALLSNENAWTDIILALGRSDVLADERFSTVEALRRHERLLPGILAPEFASRTFDELEELIRHQIGGSFVPILDPDEVVEHPQTKSLGFVEGPTASADFSIDLPIRHIER